MKKNAYIILNMLLAVAAITSILIAVSTQTYLLIIFGLLSFFIMFLLRFNQIGKINRDLENNKNDAIETNIENHD